MILLSKINHFKLLNAVADLVQHVTMSVALGRRDLRSQKCSKTEGNSGGGFSNYQSISFITFSVRQTAVGFGLLTPRLQDLSSFFSPSGARHTRSRPNQLP